MLRAILTRGERERECKLAEANRQAGKLDGQAGNCVAVNVVFAASSNTDAAAAAAAADVDVDVRLTWVRLVNSSRPLNEINLYLSNADQTNT